MTRDLQRLIDGEAEVGVDLNHAAAVAAVARERAPRLVADELDRDAFTGRQGHVRHRPAAALVERRIDDGRQAIGRNREPRRERHVAIDQAVAVADDVRDLRAQVGDTRLLDRRWRHAEEADAFLVVGPSRSGQQVDAGNDRRKVGDEALHARVQDDRVGRGPSASLVGRVPDPACQRLGLAPDRRQRRRIAPHVGDGVRGSRVEIERIGIALAERDGQPHVLPRLVVERRGGRRRRQHSDRTRAAHAGDSRLRPLRRPQRSGRPRVAERSLLGSWRAPRPLALRQAQDERAANRSPAAQRGNGTSMKYGLPYAV